VRASHDLGALGRPLLWGPMGTAESDSTFALPAGTVTFLLTDIERSTRAWEEHGDGMGAAVRAHYAILDEAIARHGGVRPIEQGEGDSVVAAFSRASDALAAALDAQRALTRQPESGEVALRLRVALHTAEAQLRDEGNYFGTALARCARIRALAAGGVTLLSRPTRDLVADRLPRDAGLVDLGLHRLRDLGRPEHLFALSHPDLPPPPLRLASLDALRHNLPTQLTSFVGRERELADVQEALAGTRLLTLTGAGGCGKTRLAAQVAAERLEAFPGGVWWVELGPLADGELVERAVADAVGVHPLPGMTALDAVVAHLGDTRALVVLDNCEHVLDRAAGCAEELLRGCPQVSVLATSRAALGSGAETRWRVPSLTLPQPERGHEPIDVLSCSDAVRLFLERALKVRPNFAVTESNAAGIAQICHDLDGIPLAIELAAARVRMLSVDAIVTGLDDRFRLLTGSARGALPRQQTLRASVDWSYALLSERERMLLRRLGIFRDGWTLDAAETVCAGDGLERLEILDLMSSLVDESLVSVDDRLGSTRYRFLETVRQYALDRLREAGEVAVAADRHRDAMLALAEVAGEQLMTPRGREWLDVIDLEAANLTAALRRAAETEPQVALRLCAALFLWWKLRGRFAAADEACAIALAAADSAPSEHRGRVLWVRAYLAAYGADVETAVTCAQDALAMAEAIGDTVTAARALDVLATLQMFGDPSGAQALARRSHELAAAAGDDWCRCDSGQILAHAHLMCGDALEGTRALDAVWPLVQRIGSGEFQAWHWLGHALALVETRDTARWRDHAERALACADAVREPTSGDFAATTLTWLAMREGCADEMVDLLTRRRELAVAAGTALSLSAIDLSLAVARMCAGGLAEAEALLAAIVTAGAGGFTQMLATAHGHLADIALVRGDAERAAGHADRLAELGAHMANARLQALARHLAGRAATAAGRPGDAEPLLHEALAARLEDGHDLLVPDSLEALGEVAAALEADIDAARLLAAAARARTELRIVRVPADDERWSALAQRLRETLGDAAYEAASDEGRALSLEDAVAWVRRARGSRRRPAHGWESLTPAEREVVELAAEGLTNRQIGDRLFISGGTAKVHLAHAYAKLDVHNRAELATLAAARLQRPA
jgi:predicted ATPase/class 3 adenylate cyclase/DNA-binding CsgD family transcriptional regulator